MASTGRPSFAKRKRETDLKQRKLEKAAQRQQRKEERSNQPRSADGEDPDIAGIVPGPQPVAPDDE